MMRLVLGKGLALALVSVLGSVVQAGGAFAGAEAESRSLSELTEEELVIRATDVCRTTPLPSRPDTEEAGDYLQIAEELASRGPSALAALEAVTTSEETDRFEKRIALILAARIRDPESFDAVAPYLVPVPIDEWSRLLAAQRQAAARGDWIVPTKNLDRESMHPDDAKFRDSETGRRIGEIFSDYDLRLAEIPEENRSGRVRLAEQRAQAIERLRREIGDAAFFRYIMPRPNPKHVLAWEEALVRPFPWPMKERLARYLIRIASRDSAPSLGLILEQALSTRKESEGLGERSQRRRTAELVLSWFAANPSTDALLALSETIESAVDDEQRAVVQRLIGAHLVPDEWRQESRLYGVPRPKIGEWEALLADRESDAEYSDHVTRIRDAITEYQRSEPPGATSER